MNKRPVEPAGKRRPLLPVEEMELMQEVLDQETGCMTDMTGLIPANPDSIADMENYSGLYPYLPPVIEPEQQ